MITSSDFDFSFSGLKTAVLYYLKNEGVIASEAKQSHRQGMRSPRRFAPRDDIKVAQICAAFQEAVVDVLVTKTVRAAKQYNVKTMLLGGGVAANQRLRQQLAVAIQCHMPSAVCCMPLAEYTTDNAAMIAAAGYFMARAKQFTPWQKLEVDPNWELGKTLNPLPRQ